MCAVLVLISQIKEIRVGKNTDVLRNKELEASWQDACIFSVIFGENFESLDLIANSADEANIWVTGLTYLTTGRHKSGAACSFCMLLFTASVNCRRFCFWCRQSVFFCLFIMVALCNRADHYIFILFLLLSSFLFPRLISAVRDWMSTILPPHMVWP